MLYPESRTIFWGVNDSVPVSMAPTIVRVYLVRSSTSVPCLFCLGLFVAFYFYFSDFDRGFRHISWCFGVNDWCCWNANDPRGFLRSF